ncbi:hypothetical protein [Sphingorhabdus sp.]|uniref:hypothetical protein n=1 Tax=Sphingorhabdus sp. TaxID=1902408 RepID=UPI003982FDC4
MKILTKSLLSAGAAAAALVSTAAPAEAQYRYRDRDGISAGEVIAGAVILGGLAAVLSAGKNGRYQDGYDGDYNNGYSNSTNTGSSRAAINQCINQVENQTDGYNRSNVTQIRSIDRTRNGYRVMGTVEEQNSARGDDRYDQGERYGQNNQYYQENRYGQDDRYDRSGNGNAYNRGYESGQFTCYVERGRVVDIDYNGSDRWN